MENFMCKAYHVYQSGNICETPLLEAETKEELRVKLENYYNDNYSHPYGPFRAKFVHVSWTEYDVISVKRPVEDSEPLFIVKKQISMKNLVIQYKKTQYNLIPLHDEQLNGRVAGWNSEIVRGYRMRIRIDKDITDPLYPFIMIIERDKVLADNVEHTVFCKIYKVRKFHDRGCKPEIMLCAEVYQRGVKYRGNKFQQMMQNIANKVFGYE